MKFTKDSKIVKISAYAEGYYSGAEAYGELFIPYNFYKTNEDKIKKLSVYVPELDGKYSEVKCKIEIEEMIIENILLDNIYESDRNLDEVLFYDFCDLLDLDGNSSDAINKFSNAMLNIRDSNKPIIKDLTLSEDTIIEGITIPKGTLINYSIHNKTDLTYWSWGTDWNI